MADKSDRNGPASGRSRANSAKTRFSTTISSTSDVVDDSIFQIDKVLYNLYGDIASALRACETIVMKARPRISPDADMSYGSSISVSTISSHSTGYLEERQNEAIMECLRGFMDEQTNIFTEAIIDGLNERAAELITLPDNSHSSQINEINANEIQMIEPLDPFPTPKNQSVARDSPQPSQQSQAFSMFAAPSSVRSIRSQQSGRSRSASEKSFATTSSVRQTPHYSPFEFDTSAVDRTMPQLDDLWFDESSAQPITPHSNFRDDQVEFLSPFLDTRSQLQPSPTGSNNRLTPSERSRSLFNISTDINPHLQFDSVRAHRSGAGSSGGRSHSNNSDNKYEKPFKSIQSDTELVESTPKHGRAGTMTPSTVERTQVSGSAAAVAASSEAAFSFQRPSTSNDVNRQTQSNQRAAKQSRKSKFIARSTEYFQSEQFQRLHRRANSVKSSTASSDGPNERSAPSVVMNGASSTAANASGASIGNDAPLVPLSPFLESCVLPPPPGF